MFAMLAQRFKMKDGYTLERGHDTVVIEKLRRRSVRVVLKDAAVTREDVSEFESDTSRSDCHGIMCMSESKVAHRNFIDFRRLASGGYAFYLVNVGDDADTVVAFVRVLYGFEDRRDDDTSGERLKNDVEWAESACKKERDRVREVVAAAKYEKIETLRELWDVRDDSSSSRGTNGCKTMGARVNGSGGASGSASGASATSGGASGSARGASASAERLKRDCQTAEIRS